MKPIDPIVRNDRRIKRLREAMRWLTENQKRNVRARIQELERDNEIRRKAQAQ